MKFTIYLVPHRWSQKVHEGAAREHFQPLSMRKRENKSEFPVSLLDSESEFDFATELTSTKKLLYYFVPVNG
jgi:hypothetical protein